jgi:hypothetical protein
MRSRINAYKTLAMGAGAGALTGAGLGAGGGAGAGGDSSLFLEDFFLKSGNPFMVDWFPGWTSTVMVLLLVSAFGSRGQMRAVEAMMLVDP